MIDICPHCQIATPCDCDTPTKTFRIKPRKRAGSFDQFVERYHPIELDNNGLILHNREDIPPHMGSRHIWTVVEGDNNRMYLVPGWSIVNRIGYVVCDVPWCEVEYTNPGYVY